VSTNWIALSLFLAWLAWVYFIIVKNIPKWLRDYRRRSVGKKLGCENCGSMNLSYKRTGESGVYLCECEDCGHRAARLLAPEEEGEGRG
jgi:hypothetical protein